MKNYLLSIISIALIAGCHLKKKTSEINTIDQQTVVQNARNVKTQTNLKTIQIDSSKFAKLSIDNLNYAGSVEMEFDLTPTKEKPIFIPDKTNSVFFEHLLNKSQKVKIHINRNRQKSNIQLLTQKNNIQSKKDSDVSKNEIYKQILKTHIREKNKSSTERKTYTALMWWIIIATCILIVIYILKKFNIYTIIAGLFKL